MATKSKSYLHLNEQVELSRRGLVVYAYTRRNKYLGRVEISQAGLAVYTGRKGGQQLGDMSWAAFFKRLKKEE